MKKLLVSEIQKMSTNEIINLMSKENLEVLDNMVVDNIDFNREIFADDGDGQCIVTRSLFDKCLWLYPASEWDNVVSTLGSLPTMTDPLCRTIQRIVLGSAVFCQLDAQGRILLPPELRQVSEITKKAYLIGFNNKFELWSEDNFALQRKADDELLQQAAKDLASHGVLANLKL